MHIVLEDILECPVTRSPLRLLAADALRTVAEGVARGTYLHPSGDAVAEPIDGAWASERGAFVYAEREGILFLLPHLAIVTDRAAADEFKVDQFAGEKDSVRNFYDEVGWAKNDAGLFEDSVAFVAQDAAARAYHDRCLTRVGAHLHSGGDFLLDAASGPLPHAEHLAYSKGFAQRICVDFSVLALREAKKKLGDHGVYLVADLTRLPLREGSIDAAISLHTIYHIPADQQRDALAELYRVIKPGSKVVIAYNWGSKCWIRKMNRRLGWLPRQIRKLMDRVRRPAVDTTTAKPKIYTHPHRYREVATLGAPLGMEILTLQSLGRAVTQRFSWSPTLGRTCFALVYWLEDHFPTLFGRIGQYPLIILRKDAQQSGGGSE